MKRIEQRVPDFDEIIFENRNKAYGAYDLRKHYKSAASISILGAIAFSAVLFTALSFKTEDIIATPGQTSVVIVISDPVIPDYVPPEAPRPQVPPANTIRNLQPVVTDDTSEVTAYIPITQDIINTTMNGNPTDTGTFTPTPEPVIPTETKPFVHVEEMPEFPGGIPALLKYVGENLVYPADAQNTNIQGKVILKFVVNADGSVDRIEVMRSIDPLLDNEAIRVVQTLPRFKPGKQGGIPVPVWFSLPVVFRLSND